MFKAKYNGTWFPSAVRLSLATVAAHVPTEAWVDDISLVTRSPPECGGITVSATPGTNYHQAVMGSAPPVAMYSFNEAAGAATTPNVVDGYISLYEPVVGLMGTYMGVVTGVPGPLGRRR